MRDITIKLRNIVAVVSIILIAIFAFTPLLSIKLNSNERMDIEMEKVVINARLMEKLNEGEIDEEKYNGIHDYFMQNEYSVEYNAISFIKAIPNTIKYIKAFIDVQNCADLEREYDNSNDMSEEHRQNKYEELAEARAKLREIDYNAVTIESLDQFRFIFTVFNPTIILDDVTTITEVISLGISALIKLIFVFAILILFPLSMVFAILKLLGALLKKDFGKVLLVSKNTFSWAALLLAVSAILNSTLTGNGTLVVVIIAIVILFNIIASWFIKQNGEAKSLMTLQISSLISIAGLYIFVSNFIKSELGITWEETLMTVEEHELGMASFIAISVLVCLIMLLLPMVYKGIAAALARAGNIRYGINGKKKAEGIGGVIVFGIIVIAYNFILKNKFGVELNEEQASAISFACVGLGVAIVGSIVANVTKAHLNN